MDCSQARNTSTSLFIQVRRKHGKLDERTIPSIDHQYDMARLERIIKRLWIVILTLLILFAGTNALWIYEWNQYDYGSIVVDSDDGGSVNYLQAGANGVINNVESDSQD